MRYLTIVYEVPDDYDVKNLTNNQMVSAMSWSHVMDARDRLQKEIDDINNQKAINMANKVRALDHSLKFYDHKS